MTGPRVGPAPTGRDTTTDTDRGHVVGRTGRRFAAWRRGTEHDPRHDQRTAATLGVALGVCFTVCFLTGLYSHLAQHPAGWFTLPAGPGGLYRVTQGLHVATGIGAVPLLLAKLWSVYPKLLQWPAVTSVAHALERLSLLPLVGGALFMLFSGVANIDLWYPLPLFFPAGHYWVAWITIGALVVHIGAKAAITREVLLTRPAEVRRGIRPAEPVTAAGDRRAFLGWAAAGAGLLTVVTVGQTVGPLRSLGLLAPRHPDIGDGGFPVNNTAAEAHVTDAIVDPAWRLRVVGGAVPVALSLADLRALPQAEATLPIACVEGWSASRRWRGVRLADVLALAGAPAATAVTVRSLEQGLYGSAEVNAVQAAHPDTLLALEADGAVLSPDHGYPVRLIGPNRPGVMQTKWLATIEVHP